MPANPLMAEIHNSKKMGGKRVLLPENERRMPAILPFEDHETWLTGSPEAAYAIIKPYPAGLMYAYPVSNLVNRSRNDGPDLLRRWQTETVDSTT
jgi:putative SOS response-associated peptidase YedK